MVMIKIKIEDNIFMNCSEKEKTYQHVRYGIPMAHMYMRDDEYLYLVFDQAEQEENFVIDHKDKVLERYEDYYDNF